jgi:hypothetical protein
VRTTWRATPVSGIEGHGERDLSRPSGTLGASDGAHGSKMRSRWVERVRTAAQQLAIITIAVVRLNRRRETCRTGGSTCIFTVSDVGPEGHQRLRSCLAIATAALDVPESWRKVVMMSNTWTPRQRFLPPARLLRASGRQDR